MHGSTIVDETFVGLLQGKPYLENTEEYKQPSIIKGIEHTQFVLKNLQVRAISHGYSNKLQACNYHKKNALQSIDAREKELRVAIDYLIEEFGGIENCKAIAQKNKAGHKVGVFDYLETRIEFESFIIQAKSLLDTLTQLISITFGLKLKAFADSGRFLFEELEPKCEGNYNALRLCRLYRLHKKSWIDQLILHRNQAAHHGSIPWVYNYAIDLNHLQYSDLSYIQAPIVKDELMKHYLNRVMRRLSRLSFWTRELCFREMKFRIENCDKSLLEFTQGNLKCHCGSGLRFNCCHGTK
jgi:hypothetical protein